MSDTLPQPCTCGSPRDPRGMCTHCDYPIATCPPGCVACRTRDSQCVICHTPCGTPVAAEHHQNGCRQAENRKAARP